MKFLPPVLDGGDGYLEVNNVFSFSPDTAFVLLCGRDEDEERYASALLRVPTDKPDAYEVVDEFDSDSLNYFAADPSTHFIQQSGEYMRVIRDGELGFHDFVSEDLELMFMAGVDSQRVVVFGEGGNAFVFQDGSNQQVPCETGSDLYCMHVPARGPVCAGGEYGAFLTGTLADGLTEIDTGGHDELLAVHVKPDGTVMIGCDEGTAMVYEAEEYVRMEGYPGNFRAVNVFLGQEYWGDDEFGLYTRKGNTLVPLHETTYAFHINASDKVMAVNAGYRFYLFDGTNWQAFKVNPRMDSLIERMDLDFEPGNPG